MSQAERRWYPDGPGTRAFLFVRGGNELSGKDPRSAEEIASVGWFTGAGNIIDFIGPWSEADARYDKEVVEAKARMAAG